MANTCAPRDSNRGEAYEIIPARGQELRVLQGERFENKLIDVSTGNSVSIHVTGANSVIRNIGFSGRYRGDGFLLSVEADPGDVRFENVYLGDGASKDGSRSVHGPGAVLLHRENEADVTFQCCNVQEFPNNGFHCSNTAQGPSSVRFDRCFGKNNGVATFRCGGGDDRIENCVAYTDSTGDGHAASLETNGRPVWVWNGGTVTIRDSHFADGPYPNAIVAGANDAPGRISFESGGYRGNIQRTTGSTVDVGSDVATDPDLTMPDGVPTSAEAAASGGTLASAGGAGGDPEDRFPHVVEFDGSEADEPCAYSFEATTAVAVPDHDPPTRDEEVVSERPVRGFVCGGVHAYRFDGDLASLSVRGDATVNVQYDVQDPVDTGGASQS